MDKNTHPRAEGAQSDADQWVKVRYETHDNGRIAIVQFDRGHASNTLAVALCRKLRQVAQSFESDTTLSAVILTGRADNFSMGADLRDPERKGMEQAALSARRLQYQTGGKMCRAWEEIELLTIAAIEGWCVGGGAAISVCCDLRVAAENATLYVPEIERGMNLSWGAVPRITNLVGPAKAKRIVMLSEKLSAQQGLDWGLIDQIAKPGQALEAALAFARQAASLPPVQMRMIKQAVNASAMALDRAVSHADYDQFGLALGSGDYAEGVASFMEKRPPKYTGA